jgi:predicted NUDIX family phosphoesterase
MSKSTSVLVIPRSHCSVVRDNAALKSTLFWWGWHWPREWQWLSRDVVETDENFLQVIPYVVLRNPEGKFWAYARGQSDEARLHGKRSVGVGGHIEEIDRAGDTFKDIVSAALTRELREELGIQVLSDGLNPVCWVYDGSSSVGRVHLGLVYVLPWPAFIEPQSAEGVKLVELGFLSPEEILSDSRFENWSQLVVETAHKTTKEVT